MAGGGAERGAADRGGDRYAFSFPQAYFEAHGLALDWGTFLEDFRAHWPTDEPGVAVDVVREGGAGRGALRSGSARWRRLTDIRNRAKSPFHFDVPGSVAKTTHAGLPWLHALRARVGARVHVWPFDGWTPRAGVSVVAEIYPALSSHRYPREDRTPDQHDAYSACRRLQEADRATGELDAWFQPKLEPAERRLAEVEGWILGGG